MNLMMLQRPGEDCKELVEGSRQESSSEVKVRAERELSGAPRTLSELSINK